jgi:nucleotide-binding universal stress UspA family protein
MNILLVSDTQKNTRTVEDFCRLFQSINNINLTILGIENKSINIPVDQMPSMTESTIPIMGNSTIEYKIRVGNFYDQVMLEVNECQYDLLVVPDHHPKYFFSRYLRSSTTVRIVENSPCSVMILRGETRLIRKILLCDSGFGSSSTLSRNIIELAQLIEGDEDVTVLHVMSQISAGPGVRGKQLREDAEELIHEASPEGILLVNDLNLLNRTGIHPYPKIRHGFVVEEILDEARSGNYDLVVIGAHPQTGPIRFILENITTRIIKEIDRTLLIARKTDWNK